MALNTGHLVWIVLHKLICSKTWVVSHYPKNKSSQLNNVEFISKRYDIQNICGKELCVFSFINPPAAVDVMDFGHNNKFLNHKVERVGWSRWGTRRSRRWPLSEPIRVSPELLTLSHTTWQPHSSSKLNLFIFKALFRISKIFFGSIYTHP